MTVRSGDLKGLDALDSESLGVFCWSDSRPLAGVAGFLDWRLAGALSRTLLAEQFKGDVNESMLMPVRSRLHLQRVFVFGLGQLQEFNRKRAARVCRRAVEVLTGAGVERVCLALPTHRADPAKATLFLSVIKETVGDSVHSILLEPALTGSSGLSVLSTQSNSI